MRKIQIILGSTRPERFGSTVAEWVQKQTAKYGSCDYEFIDLRKVDLPMFNEPRSPARGEYEHEHTKQWAARIKKADGYLIVTPEYNHGYPAALKNAFDYAYQEWNNKPIGFVSYGGSAGGARAVEQLRLVTIELQMAPIRNSVHFVNYWEAFNEDGDVTDGKFEDKAKNLVEQLEEWAQIFKSSCGE